MLKIGRRTIPCAAFGAVLFFLLFYTQQLDVPPDAVEKKHLHRFIVPSYPQTYPSHVQRMNQEMRRILLWTPWFEKDIWFFESRGTEAFKSCPESRCEVTTDKLLLYSSDLVLFHVRDLENGPEFLPPSHPLDQSWVFMNMESPVNTWLAIDRDTKISPKDLSPLNYKFNLTMTYLKDSDVQIQYGRYAAHLDPMAYMKRDYSKGKDRLALWYVSNCFTEDSKIRTAFVEELAKHIQIDVYGMCGKADPCNKDPACVAEMKTRYKFYLALENSICKDYVTEKLWETYQSEMIPIVLGAQLQDYIRIAPPDSFLHVQNFSSVKSLADYILYLDQNDEAYNRYFKWKERYVIKEDIPSAICKLCEAAHNLDKMPPKSYEISQWWNPERLCKSTYM